MKRNLFSIKTESTLNHLFDEFLLSKKAQGVQEKTLLTYKQHLNAIGHHLDLSINTEELTKADIEHMIVSMRDSHLSPNSIKSYMITLRAFINWCRVEGYTSLSVGAYKGTDSIKDTYTDEELRILLTKPNLRKCGFAEYRNWVIINFLINSGCRAKTLREIQNRDVDLEQSICVFRHTKSQKGQIIPICSELKGILRDYMKIRKGKPDDFLFCSEYGEMLTEQGLRSAIARYNIARGIQKTSIHLFRHTFAKLYLLDCGGNAFTLQRLLGHSTLDMTKHYCGIYDKDITRNYDLFSPLEQIQQKKKHSIAIK